VRSFLAATFAGDAELAASFRCAELQPPDNGAELAQEAVDTVLDSIGQVDTFTVQHVDSAETDLFNQDRPSELWEVRLTAAGDSREPFLLWTSEMGGCISGGQTMFGRAHGETLGASLRQAEPLGTTSLEDLVAVTAGGGLRDGGIQHVAPSDSGAVEALGDGFAEGVIRTSYLPSGDIALQVTASRYSEPDEALAAARVWATDVSYDAVSTFPIPALPAALGLRMRGRGDSLIQPPDAAPWRDEVWLVCDDTWLIVESLAPRGQPNVAGPLMEAIVARAGGCDGPAPDLPAELQPPPVGSA
jgi:hypothetical protein